MHLFIFSTVLLICFKNFHMPLPLSLFFIDSQISQCCFLVFNVLIVMMMCVWSSVCGRKNSHTSLVICYYTSVVFSLCKELSCFTLENVIELEFNRHTMYVFFHVHVASSLVVFRLKEISEYIIVSIFKNSDLLSVRPHPQRMPFCVCFSLASTQKQSFWSH